MGNKKNPEKLMRLLAGEESGEAFAGQPDENPGRLARPSLVAPKNHNRWRAVFERLAPLKKVSASVAGETAFVHWLELTRKKSGAYSLDIRWRVHKPTMRGLGKGHSVPPGYALSQLDALLTPEDKEVFVALGLRLSAQQAEPKATCHVPSERLDYTLRALSKARFVRWEHGERVVFDPLPAIPRIIVVETDGRLKISAEWTLADGKDWNPGDPHILAGSWPWVEEDGVLRPIFGVADGEALYELLTQGLFVSGADIPSFIGGALPAMQTWGARLGVNVSKSRKVIADAKPVPMLYLDEEDGKLAAMLKFRYGQIEVSDDNPSPILLLDMGEGPVSLIRDSDAEFAAVKELKSLGLAFVEPGKFSLEGDDALDFVREGLARLSPGWEIFGRDTLKQNRVSGSQVSMGVRVSSGIDWLEIDADCKAGASDVDIERVLKALKKGSRYVKLGDGSHALMPEKWLGGLGNVIEETGDYLKGEKKLGLYMAPLAKEVIALADRVQYANPKSWDDAGKRIRNLKSAKAVKAPKGLTCKLRPYQERGLGWLRLIDTLNVGGVLADDMGLGKTIQALALLVWEKENTDHGPSLVIAPTSVVPNWDEEIERHAPGLKKVRYHGTERADLFKDLAESDIVVTSYAVARLDNELLGSIPWNYVILDEAQVVKNAATATAQAVKKIDSRRRLALTGTLLENHLGELWSHFHFLNPGLLGSQRQFLKNFQRPISKGDKEASQRLKDRISPFILRRMKAEVAPELPPKIENILWSEFSPEQAKLYQSILVAGREKVERALSEGGIMARRASILEVLLRLRQVACHPAVLPGGLGDNVPSAKFDQFCEFVEEIIEEGNRVLIYSQFVKILQIIRKWFVDKGLSHLYLDGAVRDRQTVIRKFQEDESVSAFLISLKAGGKGLNLTGADYVILFDPWWNPAVENQAVDRAHRIGRSSTVFTYRMVARGSIEEKILSLKDKKLSVAEEFIPSSSAMPFSEEEFLEILKD